MAPGRRWNRPEIFSVGSSSHLSLAETHLGLSLVEKAMGNRDAANRDLESALALAARQEYEAFPILAAGDIVAACTPALQAVP
jgi:hypothetical protein